MFRTLDDAVLRVGLLSGAALCWYSGSRLWESGNIVAQHGAQALALIGYFLAALLLFMAVIRAIPRWARLLIPLALILMWGGLLLVNDVNRDLGGRASVTDVHLFSDYAASLVRRGENPYTYDLLDAYRVYRASALYSTPLINGDITGGVSYPSLAFLIYVPFQALGIDTALIYPLMLLATLLLIYALAPPVLRPLAVVPFLVNPNYTLYALGGVNDIGWALLLCLMIAVWRRAGWRAVIFGVACAFKQQPWFLAPFLLVKLWHENADQPLRARLWVLARFSLIAASVFLLANVPYIVPNLNAWLNGILRPLFQNMIILGQGYSSLSLFGLVFFPDWFFSLLTYGLLVILLYLYARFYRRWTEALWIMPAIALWFGRRSLSSYWYFYLFPLAAALLIQYRAHLPTIAPAPVAEKPSRLWLIPVLIGAAAALGALAFAAIPNPIQISLVGPVLYGGTNTRLTVQVANHGAQPLTPRFSVESWGEQPAFWNVQQGPSVVLPGEQGLFTLATDYDLEVFNIGAGAQVIVSDAQTYGLRASLMLPAATLIYPDRVPNGDYVYWTASGDVPYGWGLVGDPQRGSVYLSAQPGQVPDRALQMTLAPSGDQPADFAVDTWLMLPQAPISLWVNPPASANRAPDYATLYGVQVTLTANAERFYVLFGDTGDANGDLTGTLPDGDPFVMIAAPPETWSQQTFSLPDVIAQLGIPLPDPEIRSVGSLQIPMRMANFRLYARSSNALQAAFGPVSMPQNSLAIQDRMIAETIQSPVLLLLWRGDINLQADNAALAQHYYQQALDADPTSGAAYYGLAAAAIKLEQYDQAANDAQAALDNGYPYTARAYWALGSAELGLERYDQAQAAFTTALDRLNRDLIAYDSAFRAKIYSGLGKTLVLQGRPQVAEGMFSQARQLDPFDLANYQALFGIYAAQGRCGMASALTDWAVRYGLPVSSMNTCK